MGQRICSVTDCGRPLVKPHGRGMCNLHYQRWRKHGDPLYIRERPKRQGVEPCVIEGCDKPIKGRDWCAAHYSRWQRHGSPTARLRGEWVDGKRVCPRCGEDRPRDDWYSTESGRCAPCHRELRAEWRSANPAPPKIDEIKPCETCGQWFPANKKRSRYCTTECFLANKNKANWVYLAARRARLAKATVEHFDRLEVFERDRWVCQLCGVPVDPSLKFPDPYSVTLDHITPISRGGEHSSANAQTAHHICNMRKGAALPS